MSRVRLSWPMSTEGLPEERAYAFPHWGRGRDEPDDNPYCLWTVGIPQRDFQNKILEDADLVIAVGYDIVEYAPAKWNIQGERKIIHIDTRAAHVNRLYQTEIEVIGNISESLKRIAEHFSRTEEPEEALAVKQAMIKEHRLYEEDLLYPLKPQKILNDVRRVLGPKDILISDVGAHKIWIARYYHSYQPNTCVIYFCRAAELFGEYDRLT